MTNLNNDFWEEENAIAELQDEDIQDSEEYDNVLEEAGMRILEYENREKKVSGQFGIWLRDGYKLSNDDLNNKDVLIKILQYDIRRFIQTVGDDFAWELKIKYRNGQPEFMTASFESSSKENNDEEKYEEMREFVNWNGFVTHKSYSSEKNMEKHLYWEKNYRYSDKDWMVDQPVAWSPMSTPVMKRTLKNNWNNIFN